ncbi:hypothetical protein ACFFGE_00850 [Brevundimonas balnearis]|uniref:Uncharacterized protein n=1 Tax=Brevundimonas balnearis TaxID=1572858 RepID=A0ABV6QYI3_9CAUL
MFRQLFGGSGRGPGAPRAETAPLTSEGSPPTAGPAEEPEPLNDDPEAVAVEPLAVVVDKMRAEALDVLRRAGLPTDEGTYRKHDGVWTHLAQRLSPEEKWALLLENPPEAGFTYGRLSDVARDLARGRRPVLAASAVLELAERLQAQLEDGSGDWDPRRAEAAESGMHLVFAVNTLARVTGQRLLPLDRVDVEDRLFLSSASEQYRWAWGRWRAEAEAIRKTRPDLDPRGVAVRVKRSLGLTETIPTILRRIGSGG